MRKALRPAPTTIDADGSTAGRIAERGMAPSTSAQSRIAERGTVAPRIRSGAASAGVLPVLAVVAFLLAAGDALGCPNCKDAVNTADPEGLNVARGYFYSILIMLAMPLTLVGSFGIYVWREMRRQERLATASPDVADLADAVPRRFDSPLVSPPT
jgi:hypothetical protein